MKHFIRILFLAIALFGSVQAAGGRNFGLGFALGDPTGFSAKYWTSSNTALDFNLGWAGYWRRDGYYDPECYNNNFYRNHAGYCDDRGYNYRDKYGYGWDIFHIHADYLFHNFDAIRSTERFPLYYGPGISVNYLDYDFLQLGVRGNFGIAWMPRRAPIDVFLEISPTMELFPGPQFDVNAGLGMRFYF
ncbi:MAG: hypothetical protein JWP91_74 [Fibrobacteres bacterium]|nr:hypothetical protein [Fibrobacterota bacterium]